MTGYTVHTGSNENFSSGWDAIFGGARGKKPAAKATKKVAGTKKATGAKKPAKRSATKKK